MKLSELMRRVEADHWRGTKNHREAARIAGELVDRLGDPPIDRLTPEHISELISELRLDNSPATINRKLSGLSTALKYGQRWGLVQAMPYIPRYRESEGRTRVLTKQEADHVAASGALWLFLLDTGARLGEALRLSERDINRQQRTVTFNDTKSGRSRTVPYGTFYSHEPQPFRLTKHQARHQWQRVRKSLSMLDDPEFTPHALRHTCATRLWELTGDIYMVKQWLGHRVLATTERYTHVSPSQLLAIRDKSTSESVSAHSQLRQGQAPVPEAEPGDFESGASTSSATVAS